MVHIHHLIFSLCLPIWIVLTSLSEKVMFKHRAICVCVRETDRQTDIHANRQTDRCILLLDFTDLITLSVDELSSNLPLNCLKMNVTSDCLQYLTSSKRTIAEH